MALTVKHRDDGSFFEQGGTQGVLVPMDLPTSRINKLATTASSGWWPISLAQEAGAKLPFCTVVNGNAIRIDEDGVYAIHSGYGIKGDKNGQFFEIMAYFPDNSAKELAMIFYTAGDISLGNVGCPCVTLYAGTRLQFRMYNTVSNFVSEVTPIEICKLIQRTPYIIANKGALVFGGAFQFDDDGNVYTENYSTTEMRVGVWIDGKPIYKKTLDWLPLGPAGKYTQAHGAANFKRLVKMEAVIARNDETAFYNFPSGTNSDGNEAYCDSTSLNINVDSTGWSNGYKFQATIYYTKTTD
jgi:hypothetical protein